MEQNKSNFDKNINLTLNVPIVDIEKIKKEEKEKMFTFLPILRNQGLMPNREINSILNQSKMSLSKEISKNYKTVVQPNELYSFNFFPSNK